MAARGCSRTIRDAICEVRVVNEAPSRDRHTVRAARRRVASQRRRGPLRGVCLLVRTARRGSGVPARPSETTSKRMPPETGVASTSFTSTRSPSW